MNRITVVLIILAIFFCSCIIASSMLIKLKRKERFTNKRFKSLFDNMKEGFAVHEIICDDYGMPVDYKFLEVNHEFENITGLKADQVSNKTVKEIWPGMERYWIEKYGEVALGSKPISFTKFSQDLGRYFNVSVYSIQPKQFVTVFSDITEQVSAKEKIELERQLLETILEDTLSGYFDWDIENHKEYLSPSFKRMLGYKDEELGNSRKTWHRLIFKEDLEKIRQLFNQHVESRGKVPFYNEIRYNHKNGSIVWVICSGRVVDWGTDNRPLRMVGCHINITNSKKLEKYIRDERTLFQTTLHALGDGVISTDKNGNVDLMNGVAEKITGWSNVEAKGMDFEKVFNIINERTRIKCENPVKRVFETGEIIELANHTMLIKKNGDEIPIEDSAAPIKDEKGNTNGVVIVFRDFTDKKEKQATIRYLSYHDQLTGLYNRHFFEKEMQRIDNEENLPFTIVMLDVNGLKLTNDVFGHQMGDELLKRVANVLNKECLDGNIVARVGGDEFVILLSKISRDETEKIIKRIYSGVEQEQFDSIIISVSIGWETKTSKDQHISEIYAKAEDYMYRKKLTESQSMRNQTIQSILKTLNETNEREKFHSEKVSEISRKIGEAMNLEHEKLSQIETAGLMHDIGKITINQNLLNKPGKLTESEYEEIKKHTESGYHILKSVDSYTKLADYILGHHERWDGKGYPRGLSGEGIPLISRIIAIADSYEAMTGNRMYQKTKTKEEALLEIKRCAGTQFDPQIVEVFLKSMKEKVILNEKHVLTKAF